jgi:hypothetical protein
VGRVVLASYRFGRSDSECPAEGRIAALIRASEKSSMAATGDPKAPAHVCQRSRIDIIPRLVALNRSEEPEVDPVLCYPVSNPHPLKPAPPGPLLARSWP